MQHKSSTDRIKQKGRELGFDLIGISSAEPHVDIGFFDRWLEKKHDGTMAYLKRRRDDRADLKRLLPSVKSLICCGINYYGGETPSLELRKKGHGWISRYAWGDDYHDVVLKKLQELEVFIVNEIDPIAELKSYVDTGPILERSYAAQAGLGWIGKNTLLINQEIGSYFFIGEILCSLELETDAPTPDHCGSCSLCMDSCPTDALTPYELDATRCISYLTIEHRGDIPSELNNPIDHHIVGCDICQEVCPWNRTIPLSHEVAFKPREQLLHPKLEYLENLSEEEFRQVFRKSAVKRTKWQGLQRNLKIVRGNQVS